MERAAALNGGIELQVNAVGGWLDSVLVVNSQTRSIDVMLGLVWDSHIDDGQNNDQNKDNDDQANYLLLVKSFANKATSTYWPTKICGSSSASCHSCAVCYTPPLGVRVQSCCPF